MPIKFIVLICADAEWKAVRDAFPMGQMKSSALGDWFVAEMRVNRKNEKVLFFHTGWGKIAAAASTQYVIDKWSPQLLVNLGTCGGFKGRVKRDAIILVNRTIVYDIIDQMTDDGVELSYYDTDIDISWIRKKFPQKVLLAPMVSGDRDVDPEDVDYLKKRFGAVAADWESGSVAYVAIRNGTRCLILRGISDLVDKNGGEAYGGNAHVYIRGAAEVMSDLVKRLPSWLELAVRMPLLKHHQTQ